ncbi:ABC transporter ATP-binding protein [Enterovibrio coralii]|uniref:Peptide ABC transporter ATP-binding protein n=1 Tax=Enterovibrio coralii TaxID=294935 RepID=A0A135I9F8_9GAMM|nr:oligopeptide/dipeptide ABC transporter ATP-binding protein [Enterovibrio coralii]KXF82067.1 peptide ABC transporter ATP-binding protein [Enterovibrio coralii]
MTAALQIQGLKKTFFFKKPLFASTHPSVKAVRTISLDVAQGETLGIVGESGCGKSTLARMLVGLTEPTEGQVLVEGEALSPYSPEENGKRIQYVFQDPISSLNPRKTIGQLMEVPLLYLHGMDKSERESRIREIFGQVGLREEFLTRYPHEFSGGQAQRIGIARALAANARILVLDEPVSALDVSVQAQVLNLLAELKQSLSLTYLFISHDLAVVEAVSDRVAVMYFGALVELAPAERIFNSPKHPYTQLLANSAPVVGRPLQVPTQHAELPDPLNPPKGCAFAGRCPKAQSECLVAPPPLTKIKENEFVACFFPLE